jgi:hypothetical protein
MKTDAFRHICLFIGMYIFHVGLAYSFTIYNLYLYVTFADNPEITISKDEDCSRM